MDPIQSHLQELKNITNFDEFSRFLNLEPKALAFLLYKLPESKKYTESNIAKKSGGIRVICAPSKPLKAVQKKIATILVNCELEIQNEIGIRNSVSHGFKPGHSILSNAKQHLGSRYVLNVDINDFFTNINFGRIYGYLQKNKYYELPEAVAKIIAHAACYKGCLPQGSPLSPVISNMIGNVIDSRMLALAKKHGCTYSRYADDLTFSTRLKKFPERIARENLTSKDLAPVNDWVVGRDLKYEIKKCGFSLNDSKTRMHLRGSKQSVTGITVNETLNIDRKKYKVIRAQINNYARYGLFLPYEDQKVKSPLKTLRGHLDQLHWIKQNNGYYGGYGAEFYKEELPEKRRKFDFTAFEKLFYKFLFSKNFIHNAKVTLLFEGDTDCIYFKYAKKSLMDKKIDLKNISILNQTNTIQDIMGISGGSSFYAGFISNFMKYKNKFSKLTSKNAVVIVLDNDSGLNPVLDQIKKLSGLSKPEIKTADFIHLKENLYVVLTCIDKAKPSSESCVEDLFDKKTKAKSIRGKVFNPNLKKNEDTTTFGKGVFAREVVAPGAKHIDFSKFIPLFENIQKAQNDYEKRLQSTQ